jgi:hypothetical protein
VAFPFPFFWVGAEKGITIVGNKRVKTKLCVLYLKYDLFDADHSQYLILPTIGLNVVNFPVWTSTCYTQVIGMPKNQ